MFYHIISIADIFKLNYKHHCAKGTKLSGDLFILTFVFIIVCKIFLKKLKLFFQSKKYYLRHICHPIWLIKAYMRPYITPLYMGNLKGTRFNCRCPQIYCSTHSNISSGFSSALTLYSASLKYPFSSIKNELRTTHSVFCLPTTFVLQTS